MRIYKSQQFSDERTSLMQTLRLARPTRCWELRVIFELDSEERVVLEAHPDVKKIRLFEHYYAGIDLSPSVGQFTEISDLRNATRLVADNAGRFVELESKVDQAARDLKKRLENLKGIEGSSITETNSEVDKTRQCKNCSKTFVLRDHGKSGEQPARHIDDHPKDKVGDILLSAALANTDWNIHQLDYCPKCTPSQFIDIDDFEEAMKKIDEEESLPFWRRKLLQIRREREVNKFLNRSMRD